VERIDQDPDLHAEKKKLLRLVDEQFLAGQTPDLPKLQLQLRELKLDEIELAIGHENVLAEMLEKVLAYNVSQIIRARRKKLSDGSTSL
jgi:hypothetical protein